MTTDGKILLRVEEAADRLSISRAKLYRLIRQGELPALHIGGSTRIEARQLEAWIVAHRVPEGVPSKEA